MSIFRGFVDDSGKFALDYPAQFRAYVGRFMGEEVEIEFRKRRTKRSDRQNRYWWGVVIPLIAEHCGYSHDEMHEALKAKFLGTEDMSRGLLRIGSTAKLDTQAFAELTDRVVLWAAGDLGVIIPPPEVDKAQRKKAA